MVSSGSSHQSESLLTLARRACLNYCLIKAIWLHSNCFTETMLCKVPASIQMAQGCYDECIYALSSANVLIQYMCIMCMMMYAMYFLINADRRYILFALSSVKLLITMVSWTGSSHCRFTDRAHM